MTHRPLPAYTGTMSAAQLIALHQVLEVPKSYSVNVLVGNDNVMEYQTDMYFNIQATLDFLYSHLNNLPVADETVLKSLMDAWIALGTCVVELNGGSVGNINGVTMTPGMEREEIRKQVLPIVPFYRHHEEMQRQKGGARNLNVRMIS